MSVHPDLVQVYCQTVEDGERYEVYPHAAYLLSVRLISTVDTQEFEVGIYTSPSPDTEGDDEYKVTLYIPENGSADDYSVGSIVGIPGLFCENGIYAACEGTTVGDEAQLQVCFIPRKQYCPAFPYPEQTLLECWEEAHPGVPIYENFWNYERDNSEEDTGSSGGPGGIGAIGTPL